MPDLASIIELGTTPVAGDLPVGESLKYDPDYEAVSAEIAKLGTPEASSIDWRLVVNRSAGLLERTKDLFLGTALANGLLVTEGMTGFAAGLGLINGMVTTFWDGFYPAKTRMRARSSAFEWLSERVEAYCSDPANAGEMTPEHVVASATTAEQLAEFCSNERMEGEDSGLGGLLRVLRAERARLAGESGGGEQSDGGTSSDGGQSGQGGGDAPRISVPSGGAALNPAGVIATRDEAFRRLSELAEFFARSEPLSPVGPLLQRATRWGKMSYKELYSELLGDARQPLLDVLGIKREEGES